MGSIITNLLHQTAFFNLTWGNYVMIAVALVFLYLAIKHDFEPLLLIPIAFGMLLVNIYPDVIAAPSVDALGMEHAGGLFYYFYKLDEWSILPSLIFMGVGAMTDFAMTSIILLAGGILGAPMLRSKTSFPSATRFFLISASREKTPSPNCSIRFANSMHIPSLKTEKGRSDIAP